MLIKNKKICLVTGGAGFIGSNLVEKLVKKNFKVFVVDNLSSGNFKNLNNIKNKINFIKSDINNFKGIKKIDYIFHLAASVSVQESLKNKKKYFNNNIFKSISFFNNIRKIPLKKFIYIASASCYANNQNNIDEESAIKPLSPYAESKWITEQLLLKLSKTYGVPFLSFRLFNVHGKNFNFKYNYTGVIGKFISKLLKKKNLIIYGNGNQTRSFIHVDDVCRALIVGAKSRINYEIFNLGSKNYVSINKLAKYFSNNIIYKSKKKDDIKHSKSKIAKIEKKLKFLPKIKLKNGIKKLIDFYYKKNLKENFI